MEDLEDTPVYRGKVVIVVECMIGKKGESSMFWELAGIYILVELRHQ